MKMLGPSSKTHCISHQVWPLWIVSFLIFPPISVYSHTCNPLKQVNTVRGESSLLPSQKHLPHSFSYSHAAILSKITISKMTCHLLILDKSFTLPLVLPRAVYSFINTFQLFWLVFSFWLTVQYGPACFLEGRFSSGFYVLNCSQLYFYFLAIYPYQLISYYHRLNTRYSINV